MVSELGGSQISTLLETLPGIANVLRSPVADALGNVIRAGARLADFQVQDAEELVRYATEVAPPHDIAAKPWFAIGGIGPDNLDEVLAAGARRVCVVRALTQATDPEAAARELGSRLRQAWRSDPVMEQYSLAAAGFTGPTR